MASAVGACFLRKFCGCFFPRTFELPATGPSVLVSRVLLIVPSHPPRCTYSLDVSSLLRVESVLVGYLSSDVRLATLVVRYLAGQRKSPWSLPSVGRGGRSGIDDVGAGFPVR